MPHCFKRYSIEIMKILLVFALAFFAVSEAKEVGVRNYNGYQVLAVEARTPADYQVLKTLFNEGELDFWTSPKLMAVTDIMVPPTQMQRLVQLFDSNGLKYSVKFADVQKLIDEERVLNKQGLKQQGKIDWTSYHRWEVVEEFILGLNNHPNANVSEIGLTFEGRSIYVVKISSGGPPKKAVLIDGNIHAREWISGATSTWILNELTVNYQDYAAILADIDIYIIPFINVDGYEFSHTGDRMWRKTRSTNPGSTCLGCDPNRNFAFHWGGESTSTNPCSDTFLGPAPFSESETAAVRDFVESSEAAGVTFVAYITLHSYANMWLLPWGYTGGVYPPDYAEQLSLGRASIAALQAVHGTRYETGQGADLLYGVGGASDDWAKDHGIKYTTTVEMRGTSFVLPPAQIIPNAEEIWAGIKEYFKRVNETNPTAEDPQPITTVETCGGLVESSSAAINFRLDANLTPNQRCVWTVRAPYHNLRFRLASSGLGSGDHLYVTKYDFSAAGPGQQIEIVNVDQNYLVSGGVTFITLIVGAAQTQGFSLEFYSSGFGDSSPTFSGFQVLTSSSGSISYPASGQYQNNENALLIVNPEQAGDRTLTFTAVDVENDAACAYDAVSVFTWTNNNYTRLSKFCGTSIPSPFSLPGGLGFVTLTSDSSVVGRGFSFNWS